MACATRPSNVRVYQFHHPGGNVRAIIAKTILAVKQILTKILLTLAVQKTSLVMLNFADILGSRELSDAT